MLPDVEAALDPSIPPRIEIGDDAFRRRFSVRAADQEAAEALLGDGVRAWLIERDPTVPIHVADRWVACLKDRKAATPAELIELVELAAGFAAVLRR